MALARAIRFQEIMYPYGDQQQTAELSWHLDILSKK